MNFLNNKNFTPFTPSISNAYKLRWEHFSNQKIFFNNTLNNNLDYFGIYLLISAGKDFFYCNNFSRKTILLTTSKNSCLKYCKQSIMNAWVYFIMVLLTKIKAKVMNF